MNYDQTTRFKDCSRGINSKTALLEIQEGYVALEASKFGLFIRINHAMVQMLLVAQKLVFKRLLLLGKKKKHL